jgi:hypothetical protein
MSQKLKFNPYLQKLQCLHCDGTLFRMIGFFYDGNITQITIQCEDIKCQKTSKQEIFTLDPWDIKFIQNGKIIECKWCKGEVFKVIGLFSDGDTIEAQIQCENYQCRREEGLGIIAIPPSHLELIEKGSRCDKCNTYNLSREWDKNQRGYKIYCYNCYFQDFEPE